jgi:hypothetical protein
VDNREELNLKNELKKIMSANSGMVSAVESFHSKANPQLRKQMVDLIIRSLHKPGQDDFWEDCVEYNCFLLEILRNLKSAGCEVEKPLLYYSSMIHESGVRDEKNNLLEGAKQHLLDVGLTIDICRRRSYQPRKISMTHWRRSL